MSIASVLAAAANRHERATALADPTRSVTYRQLDDRVRRLANALRSEAVRTVLCLLPNCVEAVETDLAITEAGLIRVALNPRLQPADWRLIAQDSGADAVIYSPQIDGAEDFAAEFPVRIATGEQYESFLSVGPDTVLPEPDEDAICAIHYSSGTTGQPKGALRTHRNRLTSLRGMVDEVLAPTLSGGDALPIFLHAGPVIHTSGLFVLPMIELGGTQILVDHLRPAQLPALVAEHRVTHTVLVPTVIARLLGLDDSELAPLRQLQMLAYAGAPMPTEHTRAALQRITANLVQYYGMVEAIPPVTVLSAADHRRGLDDGELLASIGKPCRQALIEIDGASGELTIGGPMVSPGYHDAGGRDDLGKAFANRRLFSGDLGHYDNGYLYLTGRAKDMIITGGYNVYPREVEEVLLGLPGVADAVVVGLPDAVWGQRVVAGVVPAAEATSTPEQLREACRDRLADYKRPKTVTLLDALPLTALGKVDRAAATNLLSTLTRNETQCP